MVQLLPTSALHSSSSSTSGSPSQPLLSSHETTIGLLPLPQAHAHPSQTPLWFPGSTSYTSPVQQVMDPSEAKLQLQTLYEELSESSYDLSLKDIVDPYSISGKLKPGLESGDTSTACHSRSKNSSSCTSSSSFRKSKIRLGGMSDNRNNRHVVSFAPRCKLSFSFSFPRIRSMMNSSGNLSSGNNSHPKRGKPKISLTGSSRPEASHVLKSKRYRYIRRNNESSQPRFTASKIHPSNQCSSCSSYTIFFKSMCSVCRKPYCRNCAKDAMDVAPRGRRCKEMCSNGRPSRRWAFILKCLPSFRNGYANKDSDMLTSKTVKSCWPFFTSADVQELSIKALHV